MNVLKKLKIKSFETETGFKFNRLGTSTQHIRYRLRDKNGVCIREYKGSDSFEQVINDINKLENLPENLFFEQLKTDILENFNHLYFADGNRCFTFLEELIETIKKTIRQEKYCLRKIV